jgi:hypothetical protein
VLPHPPAARSRRSRRWRSFWRRGAACSTADAGTVPPNWFPLRCPGRNRACRLRRRLAPPPPPEPVEEPRDELADALEKDFNHYLTSTAKEYYPDTDQMLFKVGFGGQGVKKVYNCPLRRRPVSESIAMEDFIVSNALTDLAMRAHHAPDQDAAFDAQADADPGVYRDDQLAQPTRQSTSPTRWTRPRPTWCRRAAQPTDPEDADYEVYECYCELDLDEYAPTQFKGKGLPLPYKVTIEKESQKVLEIRRNWKEDDKQCMAKEFFVDFPYMQGVRVLRHWPAASSSAIPPRR